METILIIIHLVIVIALVIVVLLQRSEGGALGIGGGGGGMMTARGAASALTRLTAILAAGFFITSLSLGLLARYGSQPTDILDRLPVNQQGGTTIPGAAGTGSLLDQLGGLPAEDAGTVEAVDPDQPLTAPNAATAPAGTPPAPADAEPAPVTITPNETTSGAASEPVEAPSAPPAAIPQAIDRPTTGGSTGTAE
jgi:preprotein translocase subunit SecG